MVAMCITKMLLVGLLLVCIGATPAMSKDDWFVSLYGGQFSNTPLLDILRFDTDFEDSRVFVFSLGKRVSTLGSKIAVELEGQVAKHEGRQNHEEFNAAVVLRWLPFPWDQYLDTSFAMGNGLSYATEDPSLEIIDSDENRTSPWLYYIMVELAFNPPKQPRWDLFARVHHRSSVFGAIDGLNAGSNFVGLGLRYRF